VKISRVDPFHVDWGPGRSRSAWVRIWTDGGLSGLGEASPMVHGNASLEIIASAFAPMLLGADPLEPCVIQDRLFHQHIKLGPEGAYAGALAAIDIALWDLRGKALGQPVCQDVVWKTPVRPVHGKFVLSDAPGLGLDEAELGRRAVPWRSSAGAAPASPRP
jgi:L-alanine-DL-glutamate epimerase-like enolase superfamily enzyme